MIKICSALIKKKDSQISLLIWLSFFFYEYRADALHRVEAKRKRDGTAKKYKEVKADALHRVEAKRKRDGTAKSNPKTICNVAFLRQIFSSV